MLAWLEIKYEEFDGTWVVSVKDSERNELYYNRSSFKFTAWISYFIWKHIRRRFGFGNDIEKWIEL